jgi:uncharacterized membrane protein YgcG
MIVIVCGGGAFILGITGNLDAPLNQLPRPIPGLPSASSAGKSVVVPRRDGEMTILPNGSVKVTETWQVQFIGGPFTNAFRTIPLHRVNAIGNWTVGEDDRNYANFAGASNKGDYYFLETRAGDADKLTWFFPATSNQTRTFVLHYVLNGALRIYPNGDQLWWKFIEADRGYTINASRVVVHLPANAPTEQLKATTYLGISDAGNATIRDGRTIEFTGGPFPPQTEWEVRAQFPHGIVSAPVPSWQARAEEEDRQAENLRVLDLANLFGAMLLLVGSVAGAIAIYFVRARPYDAGLVAEYLSAPPDDRLPAEADILLEEKASPRDIMATLVDLARRGVIRMQPTGGDFLFERVRRDAAGLKTFEAALLDKFFDGKSKRHLSSLTYHFSSALKRLYDQMYQEIVRAGDLTLNPEKFKSSLLAVSTTVFWVGMPALVALFLLTRNGWLAIVDAVVILTVSALFSAMYLKIKVGKTRHGAQSAAKWAAFKRYLIHIERYTQVKAAQEQFEKYLPYAIAFGIEQGWVKKFAAVDTPAPTWYAASDKDRRDQDDDESDRRHRHSSRKNEERESSTMNAPSLNDLARGSFNNLNSMSHSFFAMLNSATDTLTSTRPSSSSGSSSSSSSGSSSGSSFSGGGSRGGGSGGGSSGFG